MEILITNLVKGIFNIVSLFLFFIFYFFFLVIFNNFNSSFIYTTWKFTIYLFIKFYLFSKINSYILVGKTLNLALEEDIFYN